MKTKKICTILFCLALIAQVFAEPPRATVKEQTENWLQRVPGNPPTTGGGPGPESPAIVNEPIGDINGLLLLGFGLTYGIFLYHRKRTKCKI
jgi:hypothetical protein